MIFHRPKKNKQQKGDETRLHSDFGRHRVLWFCLPQSQHSQDKKYRAKLHESTRPKIRQLDKETVYIIQNYSMRKPSRTH